MSDDSIKQLKAIKWTLIYLAVLVSMVVFGITGLFVYLNWEGRKTDEQEDSLKKIQSLKNSPKNTVNPDNLPDVEPEIYDDRDQDELFEGGNDSLQKIENLKKDPEGDDSDDDLPDVQPEIYDDRDDDEDEENP